ncbi:hypothetical protein BH11PSE11_BH11PSE11_35350 [soil metagenome]
MARAPGTFRRLLFAPFVYLAAILLLFEDWIWDATKSVLARLPDVPALKAIERQVQRLPPYAALIAFLLPGLLLLPVKLLALFAIAHGHAMLGLSVIVAAKILGTILVTRIYAWTKPALLALGWFARCHDGFISFKNRMIERLRATDAWSKMVALKAELRQRRETLWRGLKARYFTGRLGRIIRRVAARRRARNRKAS